MYNVEKLIKHLKDSVKLAENGVSKLEDGILSLPGMSSYWNRHLLNNISNMPDVNYLEIGTYLGSTFISSLYKNDVKSAYAIDDWSQFGGRRNKNKFKQNCDTFGITNYEFIDKDSFKVDLSDISHKINVYFYDGAHYEENSYAAIKYYYESLDDLFVLIVDDYDWEMVRNGIQRGLNDCSLNVEYERHLESAFCGDKNTWWNGLYVAVITK